jgi:hypothetical protein
MKQKITTLVTKVFALYLNVMMVFSMHFIFIFLYLFHGTKKKGSFKNQLRLGFHCTWPSILSADLKWENKQVWRNMALFRKSKQYKVRVNAKGVACMYIWNVIYYNNSRVMCVLLVGCDKWTAAVSVQMFESALTGIITHAGAHVCGQLKSLRRCQHM